MPSQASVNHWREKISDKRFAAAGRGEVRQLELQVWGRAGNG